MNIALYFWLIAVQKYNIGAQNFQKCATTLKPRVSRDLELPKSNPNEVKKRIVGEAVKSKYAPFQVRLLAIPSGKESGAVQDDAPKTAGDGLGCGGTIISQRHILTASHCVAVPKHGHLPAPIDLKAGGVVYVFFGLLNWCSAWEEVKTKPKGPWKNVLLAEEIILHTNYNEKLESDIAIVKVRHPHIILVTTITTAGCVKFLSQV